MMRRLFVQNLKKQKLNSNSKAILSTRHRKWISQILYLTLCILKVMNTNVKGGFQVTQAACNRFFMKQESRGVVVFLSSNTAQRAIRNRTAYCASKGAINSMVRALALDLGPLGIRVNACAPGYIYTERWDALDEKIKSRRRLNCPLRREAKGADIANVVAFLASPDSGNMTGEVVTCDAGCSCQHMPEDTDV